MPRKVIINTCKECPHFDNEYYSYNEECKLLDNRVIKWDHDLKQYPIPEDCPLPKVEENAGE